MSIKSEPSNLSYLSHRLNLSNLPLIDLSNAWANDSESHGGATMRLGLSNTLLGSMSGGPAGMLA